MDRTIALLQAIERDFASFLRDKGFTLDLRHASGYRAFEYPAFRKIESDALYVCAIQWHNYGKPRFILHFGKCGPEGVTVRGEHVLATNVFPCHIVASRFLAREATLAGAPSQGLMTEGWFRQDRPWFERFFYFSKLYPAEQVVAQLIALFPEVEEFWKSGAIGPHIWPVSDFRQLTYLYAAVP